MDTATATHAHIHIVEQDEIQHIIHDEFQHSVGTIDGKNKRNCPGCKKMFKVERLGDHVKKEHAALWDALFTAETLQASIDTQQLVKCTIAEGDHDQKFLICLGCNSIRTTDRDHFKKNGKIHSDQHFEAVTKMLAKKKGIAYVPKYKSDLDTALALIDKLKRHRAMCERDHCDVALAIAAKEDAELERLAKVREIEEMTPYMKKNVKKLDTMRNALSAVITQIKEISGMLPAGTKDIVHTRIGDVTHLLAVMISEC